MSQVTTQASEDMSSFTPFITTFTTASVTFTQPATQDSPSESSFPSTSQVNTQATQDMSSFTPFRIFTSASTKTITQPPPELPDEGTKTRIAFMENGEVFEQQDNFNNISGEAVLSVPPHGNLSELTVVLQPSTVRKLD